MPAISVIGSLVLALTAASYGKTVVPATVLLRDGTSVRVEITEVSPAGDLRFGKGLIIRPEISLLSFDHEPAPFTEEPLVIAAQTDVAITDTGPLYGFYGQDFNGEIGFLGVEWKESIEKPGTYETVPSWLAPGSRLKRIYVAGGGYFEIFSRAPSALMEGLPLERVRNIFHSNPALLAKLHVHQGQELPYRSLLAYFLAGKQFVEAEAVLHEWLSILSVIQGFDHTGMAGTKFRSLSEIQGLADPELITLRDQLFAAVNAKDWDRAWQIRKLMNSRQQEFRGTRRLQPSLIDELERAISVRSTLWDKAFAEVKVAPSERLGPEIDTGKPCDFGPGTCDLSRMYEGLVSLNRLASLVDSQYLWLVNTSPRNHYARLVSALIFLQNADRQFLDHGDIAPATGTKTSTITGMSAHSRRTPRYGFVDFGSTVRLVDKRPPPQEVQRGRRFLDILLRR